jgi:hypothetical protein
LPKLSAVCFAKYLLFVESKEMSRTVSFSNFHLVMNYCVIFWLNHLTLIFTRCEDNNKMDLRDIEWEGVDWMYLVQDREEYSCIFNIRHRVLKELA